MQFSVATYNSLTEEKTEGGAALPFQKKSDNISGYMFSYWNNIVEIRGVVSAWWRTVTIISSQSDAEVTLAESKRRNYFVTEGDKMARKKKELNPKAFFTEMAICLVVLFLVYEFGFMHPALWNSLVAKFFAPVFKNFGIAPK